MKEDIDMSYIAGILDGDGSFSILRQKKSYFPCIQLSNAFKEMANQLHCIFGGSLRIKKPQKEHHKILYVWSIRGMKGAYDMLNAIIPYLILKKDRAKYMLDFIEKSLIEKIDAIEGERSMLKMQSFNQDCLVSNDSLSNQCSKDSENPNFWSYFAGIMDTEGSFSIKKEKAHSGSVNVRYNPVIQLTMVPVDCINYIRENFSLGSFCIPKAICTQKGFAYKMSIISKDECMRFIYKILPYLRFKRGQALNILNFCENYGSVKNCRGGIPKETLEFREECYQTMRKLNA